MNDVGNVVSDAMKVIWSKYMEKLLNAENDWGGEVDYCEVMEPCCLISEEVVAANKGFKMIKAAGPTGVVSEMMRVFGTRWMTGERVTGCLCTSKGKGDPLVCGSYRDISYWSS